MAISWLPPMQAAFEATKAALSAATLLDHPSYAVDIALITDASSTHIGAVLQQRWFKQSWRPLAFFSKKLSHA
jgi:hypothetical protein